MSLSNPHFEGKAVLVTQADQLIGPAIATQWVARRARLRDEKNAAYSSLPPAHDIDSIEQNDLLVANLRPCTEGVVPLEITPVKDWQLTFDKNAHPTRRFVTAISKAYVQGNRQINTAGQNGDLGGFPPECMLSERNRNRVEREAPARRFAEDRSVRSLYNFWCLAIANGFPVRLTNLLPARSSDFLLKKRQYSLS